MPKNQCLFFLLNHFCTLLFYGNAIFDDIKPFIAGGVAGMMSWYVTRKDLKKREKIKQKNHNHKSNTHLQSFFIYPVDCIKTRIQAADLNSGEKNGGGPKICKVVRQIQTC